MKMRNLHFMFGSDPTMDVRTRHSTTTTINRLKASQLDITKLREEAFDLKSFKQTREDTEFREVTGDEGHQQRSGVVLEEDDGGFVSDMDMRDSSTSTSDETQEEEDKSGEDEIEVNDKETFGTPFLFWDPMVTVKSILEFYSRMVRFICCLQRIRNLKAINSRATCKLAPQYAWLSGRE